MADIIQKLDTGIKNFNISNYDVNDYRDRLNKVLGVTPAPVATQTKTVTPVATPVKNMSVAPVVTPVVQKNNVVTPPATGSYSVKAGDSLTKIAQANGLTLAQLLANNPQYKTNPNLVKVGATLNLTGGSPVVENPTVVKNPVLDNKGNPTITTQTPEQIKLAEDQKIAEEAGRAGLSVTEYQALNSSRNAVTKEESDKIRKDLGITGLEDKVFKKPSQTSQEIFDSAYASAGLADVKKTIDALNKEVAKDRAQLTEAIGAVDENPFLTEKSRVGRGKRLLDQVEQKISNKLAQIEAYQKAYDTGISEIDKSILRNQTDFTTDQNINTAQLNYLVAKAEKEVADLSTKKTAGTATTLGAYLKARTSGKTPEVIGTAETGYYKYDSASGKFVKVVNGTGGSGSSSFKPTAEQKSLVGRFMNSTEGAGLGFTDADKKKVETDSNFFYWTLQKANEAGIY